MTKDAKYRVLLKLEQMAEELYQLLGHKDGDITAHYCKVPTAQLIDAVKRLEPPKLPQNPRNGNVLAFPDISEVRKALKNKGGMVATGGLEPPTPAL